MGWPDVNAVVYKGGDTAVFYKGGVTVDGNISMYGESVASLPRKNIYRSQIMHSGHIKTAIYSFC